MRNKKAFSLIEVSMIMVFAGIIIIYELIILNGKINNYASAYYNAFNTLRLISYNIFADPYCSDVLSTNSIDSEIYYKCYPQSAGGEKREFPTDGVDLCERFNEFLNIPKDKLNCGEIKKSGERSTLSVNEEASNISDDILRFTTSNANKFYIDDKLYTFRNSKGTFKNRDGQDVSAEYFIVYVDINGSKKPNKVDMQDRDKYLPDIVPFAITRRGEVIPMGYPIYSLTYMTSRIRYPEKIEQTTINYENNTTSQQDNTKEELSESMTFYEAIHKAYGSDSTDCSNIDDFIDYDILYTYQLCGKLDSLHSKNKLYFYNNSNLKKSATQKIESTKNCQKNTNQCKVIIDSNSDTRINI